MAEKQQKTEVFAEIPKTPKAAPISVFAKLLNARISIRETETKKLGHNDYSNYDYFTPEQISDMVHKACVEQGLLTVFVMKREPLGLKADLVVLDIDNPDNNINFTMPTDIPAMKATNIVQQLGGAMTYTERYLQMTAFQIKDNTLDFDATNRDNSEGEQEAIAPKNPVPDPAAKVAPLATKPGVATSEKKSYEILGEMYDAGVIYRYIRGVDKYGRKYEAFTHPTDKTQTIWSNGDTKLDFDAMKTKFEGQNIDVDDLPF
jgi:hypothetical protein